VGEGESKRCVVLFTTYYVAPDERCVETLKFRAKRHKPFLVIDLSTFKACLLLKIALKAQLQPKWGSIWFDSEL